MLQDQNGHTAIAEAPSDEKVVDSRKNICEFYHLIARLCAGTPFARILMWAVPSFRNAPISEVIPTSPHPTWRHRAAESSLLLHKDMNAVTAACAGP